MKDEKQKKSRKEEKNDGASLAITMPNTRHDEGIAINTVDSALRPTDVKECQSVSKYVKVCGYRSDCAVLLQAEEQNQHHHLPADLISLVCTLHFSFAPQSQFAFHKHTHTHTDIHMQTVKKKYKTIKTRKNYSQMVCELELTLHSPHIKATTTIQTT